MALVTSKDYQLTPDLSPLAQALSQAIIQSGKYQQQNALLKQKAAAEQADRELETMGAQFLNLRGKDFTTQKKELAIMGQNAIKEGKNASVYTEAMNITNPDEMNLYLTRNALKATEARKAILKSFGSVETGPEVQSSKILDSGAVQVVYKDGTTEVKEVDQAQKDIIKRAEERGVDLQQRRAQGRGLGSDAAKVASETFKRVGSLRANNRSLQKVIQTIGEGAETGPLAAKLPSMKEASVKLDQLRSELGLDVVGSVTFGALSEGELNLALSTALPTKLEGPALTKWAKDKIAAQEKLADYLEDQAIFLSEKGNTPAMWLQKQREQAPKAPTQQEAAQPPKTITLPNGVVVRKVQ